MVVVDAWVIGGVDDYGRMGVWVVNGWVVGYV